MSFNCKPRKYFTCPTSQGIVTHFEKLVPKLTKLTQDLLFHIVMATLTALGHIHGLDVHTYPFQDLLLNVLYLFV